MHIEESHLCLRPGVQKILHGTLFDLQYQTPKFTDTLGHNSKISHHFTYQCSKET